MKFFFDNCISFRIAHALNILDEHNNIVALRDKFPPDTRDVEWLSDLAREDGNWVIVSGDTRISRNKLEREAWLEAHLGQIGFDLALNRGKPRAPQVSFARGSRRAGTLRRGG